ncbi:hypothetical protein [uncultured Pontibacter sp.]|uniref:gasdermin n=1 Tax=uncultured Pontibacter sp. TaxID=453356 RepID=UPI00261D5A9C|nr:hypothetical protein [uncultured Pontibacter sp.]
MKLTTYLKKQGYDLIDGPVRNHKPLQLWLKKGLNRADIYYLDINHAFKSDIELSEFENQALNVNSTKKDDYSFNIGITLLEEILKSLGLGTFELSSKLKTGKKVTISYDNAITKEVAVGEVANFLTNADFKHINPPLLKNANRNNILVITGIVFAKNLVVEIETDFNLDANLITSLNEVAEGKLNFTKNSQQKLRMVSHGNNFFSIAVKANRIAYNKGVFRDLKLITDTRDIF